MQRDLKTTYGVTVSYPLLMLDDDEMLFSRIYNRIKMWENVSRAEKF